MKTVLSKFQRVVARTVALWLLNWHTFHAWRLNRRAAKLSQKLRYGETKAERAAAGAKNVKVGGRSNYHERERDRLRKVLHG